MKPGDLQFAFQPPAAAFGPLRTFLFYSEIMTTRIPAAWCRVSGRRRIRLRGCPSGLRPPSFMPLRRTHRRPDPATWLECGRWAPMNTEHHRPWGHKAVGSQAAHKAVGSEGRGVKKAVGSGLVLQYRNARPDPRPRGRVVVECGEVRTPTSRTPKTQRRGRRSPAGAISGAPRSAARGSVRAAHFVIILAAVVRTQRTK